MKYLLKLSLVPLLFILASILTPPTFAFEEPPLCIEGRSDCTFVLLDGVDNKLTVINDERANRAMTPFSTFKIPNSIIALEEKIIESKNSPLTYNQENYPVEAWWPSVWKLPKYDLSTAYKFSMVAIYRELATKIGKEKMQSYLKRFDYGNRDISSGLDNFWLNGSIKISALEQVEFLKKFHSNTFAKDVNISESTQNIMKEVMLAQDLGDTKIYAKTGAGKVDDGTMLGWYVGYVESPKGTHYFAMNFNRKTYSEMKKLRITIAMNHLKALSVIK